MASPLPELPFPHPPGTACPTSWPLPLCLEPLPVASSRTPAPGSPSLPVPCRPPTHAWALTRRHPPRPAEHVPSELWEPFYTDQYAQEHVKPPVTRLLLSAELYCRAWRQVLPQLETPPSPSALLALLARRGTVPALPERPVQEADLRHQPILMVGPAPARQAPPTRRGSSPRLLPPGLAPPQRRHPGP